MEKIWRKLAELDFSFLLTSFLTHFRSIWVNFLPKSNLRPVLGSHRGPLGPQKSQIKLTIATFLSPNQMEHTVFCLTLSIDNDQLSLRSININQVGILGCTVLTQYGPTDADSITFMLHMYISRLKKKLTSNLNLSLSSSVVFYIFHILKTSPYRAWLRLYAP